MSASAPPTVLTFAPSDPTGAAGVLADTLAISSMGCHAACAITAIAVQDSMRTEGMLVVDDEWLDDQARAVLQDIPVAAIKVGAPGSTDNVQAIAEILSDYPQLPVVLDPFVRARGESSDVDAEMVAAIRELLLPQSTVLTLSLAHARRVLAVATENDAAEEYTASECAARLLEWGADHVLITGAELSGSLHVNRLFGEGGSVQNESIEHVDLPFRGAGDTLSAGIAALLAQGVPVGDAVREANEFLAQAVAGGFRIGMGDAVPDRLFWANDDIDSIDEPDEAP